MIRTLPLAALLIAAFCASVPGQVAEKQDRIERKDDIGADLIKKESWEKPQLPGRWRMVSSRSNLKILESRFEQPIFGQVTQNVQAFLEDGKLQRIVITYLDSGFFFANGNGTQRDFDKEFRELEKALPDRLAEATGDKGKRARQGKGELRTRTTEFLAGDLSLRLLCEDDLLVSLTIQPSDAVGKSWTTEELAGRKDRKKTLASRVEHRDNGDVVIEGVPMNDQHERGYCVVSALAMVMQYHGLAVDTDLLAAKAGYREGDVAKADWLGLFRATAREAKLKFADARKLNLRQLRKAIDAGEPVLVGRAFSRERDAFHLEFAQRFAQDPSATLPDPRSKEGRKDRKTWPKEGDGPGHMSVITGYNEARNEIIFTESWGERFRQRRMRVEEMEATAYAIFFFGL